MATVCFNASDVREAAAKARERLAPTSGIWNTTWEQISQRLSGIEAAAEWAVDRLSPDAVVGLTLEEIRLIEAELVT
jgi:hypothetical protein